MQAQEPKINCLDINLPGSQNIFSSISGHTQPYLVISTSLDKKERMQSDVYAAIWLLADGKRRPRSDGKIVRSHV